MNKGIIVVPFRNREEHLAAFLPHYKKLLPDMLIVVVEQADDKPFNRAKLLNIGFLEAGCNYSYCVYHDVDMLAEDANGYGYYPYPVHLATACSQFGYKLPYETYYGGVTNIPTEIMLAVNGFSNLFWSRNGEDDHMYNRIIANGFNPYHLEGKVYECFEHDRTPDPVLYRKNLKILNAPNDPTDGLSSCVYEVVDSGSIAYREMYNGEEITCSYSFLKVKL